MQMRRGWNWLAALVAVGMCAPAGAIAAEHACRGCRGAAASWGGTGCGPRYHGAVHEEPNTPDPCDHCVRWRGCNNARQMPDMLAPWQLPPGRGFQTAEQMGWRSGPCTTCGPRFAGH
jgi:hypothetical protein